MLAAAVRRAKRAGVVTLVGWLVLVLVKVPADVALILAAVVGLVVLLAFRRHTAESVASHPRARSVTFRSEPSGDLWATKLHEAGHAVVIRRFGGYVKSITVNSDGSGVTCGVFPPWADVGPVESVACDYAGGIAEGISIHSAPCSSDMASAKAELRRVPWSGRGWVNRNGLRLARAYAGQGLFGPKGDVVRLARKLPGPGTKRFTR